jgi:hypothetical protein
MIRQADPKVQGNIILLVNYLLIVLFREVVFAKKSDASDALRKYNSNYLLLPF